MTPPTNPDNDSANDGSIDGLQNIDSNRLAAYLQKHMTGFDGVVTAEKFAGGQSNPTFRIDTPAGNFVLRKQPPGELLKSAHAVDREFRVMSALQNTPVPVPKMHHFCEDRSIIGSMFLVMEYVEGETFWDSALPEVSKENRSPMYLEMIRVLGSIAKVDIGAESLATFGRPGNYYQRQVSRWSEQYRLSQFRTIKAMDWTMEWLNEHMPDDDGLTSLVHGDFRLDNLKFSKDRQSIAAVLDWELSTLGHPYADLANFCMQMRLPEGMANMSGLAGKDSAELGIPSEEYLLEQYQSHTDYQITNWPFYLTFSLFRHAAIFQGVAKRGRDGNASNTQALKLADYVEPLADIAEAIARKF